ncbi:MAG: NF038132 family protein [Chromatiaceae bacterium]|nr:NF038132 family protein [Chromatiaceae bacterium]
MFSKRVSSLALLAAIGGLTFATNSNALDITGWTGTGAFGVLGADGDVTLSPTGNTQYGYVTTNGGLTGVGSLPGVGGDGDPENGSSIISPLFSAEAGDLLEFYFKFVTSDGSGYADYAWAQLLDDLMNPVSLLFTARTTDGGDTVPGFSMPPLNATLNPSATPIIDGATNWSALGSSSGTCWDVGCGNTDWIQASYSIATTRGYFLNFGVTNWNDQEYDSGMAFDGATIAGTSIDNPVPEPSVLALFGLGLAGLGLAKRRNSAKR